MRYVLRFLLVMIVFLGLTGCVDFDNKVIFSGNSNHWNGEIVINKENGVANLLLTPKKIHETDLRQIEVGIEREKRYIGLEIEKLMKGEKINTTIPEEIINDSESLEVTVSWGANYTEEVKLTNK